MMWHFLEAKITIYLFSPIFEFFCHTKYNMFYYNYIQYSKQYVLGIKTKLSFQKNKCYIIISLWLRKDKDIISISHNHIQYIRN